jgi:hypothetical protein
VAKDVDSVKETFKVGDVVSFYIGSRSVIGDVISATATGATITVKGRGEGGPPIVMRRGKYGFSRCRRATEYERATSDWLRAWRKLRNVTAIGWGGKRSDFLAVDAKFKIDDASLDDAIDKLIEDLGKAKELLKNEPKP